ncbi:hypothetical protein CFBP2044_04850 [Xanthomonas hortorum pv. cynarae]|nr:hypothetical protein CFBP2044_04850 [Xanthomonas hortorum pv. cynarae]CAD0303560.1 hypothetical protein CFBP2044_04850 [Xanthomonas hortorum pv. cynarae]
MEGIRPESWLAVTSSGAFEPMAARKPMLKKSTFWIWALQMPIAGAQRRKYDYESDT